jgi:hypothetical protein
MTYFARGSKVAFVAAACLWALAAAPAGAADPAGRAPVVQGVIDCRKVEDPRQRLACFDAAVAKMEEADAKGDLVTLDREQRREARRQAFGFTLPSFGFLNRGEKPEDVDRVTLKVAGAGRNAQGRWVISMEGGAIWRQIDDLDLAISPRAGSTASVRRGLMGSYFMNVDGQTAMRVHRDN